jgi:hypothetical protein
MVEKQAEKETSMKQAASRAADFLLGLSFDPEVGGDMTLVEFQRTILHSRRHDSS